MLSKVRVSYIRVLTDPVHVMLHGILRVREAVLHNDVVLAVLEVTLTVRLAQARRRVVFAWVLLPVNHLH